MALAAVRDLRGLRDPVSAEGLADFETDVMAEFVMARASAGMADATVRLDVTNLEGVRSWFGRPLWEMEPADADRYFGGVLRSAAVSTRVGKAQSLSMYFRFLEARYRAELYNLTGRVVSCPVDEMNRPRGRHEAGIRVPPTRVDVDRLFGGWRVELATCRKFGPTARNYMAASLMSMVGLRINEVIRLDLRDVHWDLGSFGKLHVRFGKGAHGSGPRQRMVPLINGAERLLRWYVEDVWGLLDTDWERHGAPLFGSERKNADGSARRVGAETLRVGLADAVDRHLPAWRHRLTPHTLRHYCASELYLAGMDLIAVQELLGHEWVATTMRYVHVHRTRIEDAWRQAEARLSQRLKGL